MKNLDTHDTALQEFNKDFRTAMEEKDFEKVGQAFEKYSQDITQRLKDAAEEYRQTADSTILAKRGVRQLTAAEQKFWGGIIEAFKSPNPVQALSGADKTIPQTVIDTVIEDIENAHPLLAALNIVNTYGSVKWIFATDTHQLAAWGQLTASITQELSRTIDSVEFASSKLSAFLPVPKDILDLGAAYIDAFVRKILADALACGLEYGAISGTGKNQPIGMDKDLEGNVVNGVYPVKTAIVLEKLDVANYMPIVAQLAQKRGGRPRNISKVALIVHPADYLTKIVPATTVLATDGSFKGNIFPFPTDVYTSEEVTQGKAILGLLENYPMCVSTGGVSGNLDYSDQYQFLEDARVYLIKMTATGRPVDNNSFVVLDISNLQPAQLKVTVSNVENPIATIEADATLLGAKLNKSTVAADDTATVSVIKTEFNVLPGTDPTISYLWQVRAKTETTWTDLTSSYTGYNTANLTVKAADAEKHYRCKVTASGTATGTVYTPECDVAAASTD